MVNALSQIACSKPLFVIRQSTPAQQVEITRHFAKLKKPTVMFSDANLTKLQQALCQDYTFDITFATFKGGLQEKQVRSISGIIFPPGAQKHNCAGRHVVMADGMHVLNVWQGTALAAESGTGMQAAFLRGAGIVEEDISLFARVGSIVTFNGWGNSFVSRYLPGTSICALRQLLGDVQLAPIKHRQPGLLCFWGDFNLFNVAPMDALITDMQMMNDATLKAQLSIMVIGHGWEGWRSLSHSGLASVTAIDPSRTQHVSRCWASVIPPLLSPSAVPILMAHSLSLRLPVLVGPRPMENGACGTLPCGVLQTSPPEVLQTSLLDLMNLTRYEQLVRETVHTVKLEFPLQSFPACLVKLIEQP